MVVCSILSTKIPVMRRPIYLKDWINRRQEKDPEMKGDEPSPRLTKRARTVCHAGDGGACRRAQPAPGQEETICLDLSCDITKAIMDFLYNHVLPLQEN